MYICREEYQNDIRRVLPNIKNLEQLKGKSVLITGVSGMIGSFLADLLMYLNINSDYGVDIWALGRDEHALRKRFASYEDNKNWHMLIQDVTKPMSCDMHVNYIIHAAGDGYPEAFRKRPVETMTPAFIGTLNMLEYAKKVSANRVLYVSSGEIYGQAVEQEDGFVEDYSGYVDSTSVRSCYPMAKRAAETLMVSYAYEYDIETVIVRPSHIYGPCFSDKDNRATAQFIRNVRAGEDIVLQSQGRQMRSYTYVADCGSALLCVLLNGENMQAYNIANPDSRITIAGFAEKLAQKAGKRCIYELPTELQKQEQTPVTYAVLNTDKLNALGWKGTYSIDEGIESILKI